MDDIFLRDEDGVIDFDNERGYNEDEYPFLKEVPP